MDQNFQTSFIPKRPLAEERVERPKTVSVYLFFATIIFIASLVAAIGIFLYKNSLTNQVSTMKTELQSAEGAFEGNFIQQLETTDKRINAANAVLANHIAVTPILQALGTATLKSVQFTKFDYELTGSGATAQVVVTMSGVSQSYTAIALESNELTQNQYIKNPIFSNLTLNPQGQVLFDLTFSVDPQYVLYDQLVSRGGAGSTGASATTAGTSGSQTTGNASSSSSSSSASGTTGSSSVAFPGSGQ